MTSQVEVRVDLSGFDGTPHVFLVLIDENGVEQGWGFGPANHHEWFGPGQIFNDTEHEYQEIQQTYEITADQYRAIQDYISLRKSVGTGWYIFWGDSIVR